MRCATLLWTLLTSFLVGTMALTSSDPFDHRCFSPEELAGVRATYNLAPSLTRGTVLKLMEQSWEGHKATTRVASIILCEMMGYDISLIHHTGPIADVFDYLARGVVDADLEMWPVGKEGFIAQALASNSILSPLALEVIGLSGWFVPSYAAEDYPGSYFDFWRFYENAANLHVMPSFPNVSSASYETHEMGTKPFHPHCEPKDSPAALPNNTCVEFIHIHPLYDQGIVEQQVRNRKLPFGVVYLGETNARAAALALMEKRVPFIMYYWEPTVFIAKQKMSRVALPVYTPECFANHTFSSEGYGSVDCDFSAQQLLKVVRGGIEGDSTYRDFIAFAEAFTMTTADQLEILANINASNGGVDTAACEWVKSHITSWKKSVFNRPTYEESVSQAAQISVLLVALLLAVLICGAGVLTYKHRGTTLIKASSVPFLLMIAAGATIAEIAIAVLAAKPTGLYECRTYVFLLSESITFLLLAVTLKTWRVVALFDSKKLKSRSAVWSDDQLMRIVAGGFALNLVLDVLWLALDPPYIATRSSVLASDTLSAHAAPFEIIRSCSYGGSNGLGTMSALYKGLIMVVGMFVAYRSHTLPGLFNEAKAMAAALYNMFMAVLISIPVVYLSEDRPTALFLATVLPPCYSAGFLVAVLFAPKLYYAVMDLTPPPGAFSPVSRRTSVSRGRKRCSSDVSVTKTRSGAAGTPFDDTEDVVSSPDGSQTRLSPAVHMTTQEVVPTVREVVACSPSSSSAPPVLVAPNISDDDES